MKMLQSHATTRAWQLWLLCGLDTRGGNQAACHWAYYLPCMCHMGGFVQRAPCRLFQCSTDMALWNYEYGIDQL